MKESRKVVNGNGREVYGKQGTEQKTDSDESGPKELAD